MTDAGALNTPAPPLAVDHAEDSQRVTDRSYLGVGLYTLSEAARILRKPAATLRRWAGAGHPNAEERDSLSIPLVRREDPELVAQGLLTFSELIALLLIRRLRQAEVALAAIRSMAAQASEALQTSQPFASGRLYTERSPLLASNRDKDGASSSSAVLESQRQAIESVLTSLASQLDCAEDGTICGYWPLGKGRRVVLDPARAFGQPIDSVSGVPTRALAGMSSAGEPIEKVARWYRVDPEAVRDAVLFEQSLAAPPLPRAA
jgi:uncharacterized protein (DUF433 family)